MFPLLISWPVRRYHSNRFVMMRLFHIFRLVWSLFLFIPYLHVKLEGVFELVQTDFRYLPRLSFSVSTVLFLYHGIFSVLCWI